MFDGLVAFGRSIASFADPLSLGLVLLSSLVGVVIGALPGLTATMGVALMTTLTIKMPSNQALLVLVCTYVGAIYGGSRSAILLNIPGTPASAASCRASSSARQLRLPSQASSFWSCRASSAMFRAMNSSWQRALHSSLRLRRLTSAPVNRSPTMRQWVSVSDAMTSARSSRMRVARREGGR